MTLEVTRKRVLAALAVVVFGLCSFALFFGLLLRRSAVAQPDFHAQVLRQRGNAPPAVQAGVRAALRDFQDGYVQRDPRNLDAFMGRLFEKNDDVLILGTDRSEWSRGYGEATEFIRRDWTKWGDFRFAVDDSIVSSYGDVAWVATVGTVHFKRSDRPVRFSAILIRQGDKWLFRQMQFQYEDQPATAANLLLLRR